MSFSQLKGPRARKTHNKRSGGSARKSTGGDFNLGEAFNPGIRGGHPERLKNLGDGSRVRIPAGPSTINFIKSPKSICLPLRWVHHVNKEDKPTFNVLNHTLVPKHSVLELKEAKELLKKYRLKPYQLPYIKVSDPAAKALGAKSGDIIKIIRKSPTAGEALMYRYVVEG